MFKPNQYNGLSFILKIEKSKLSFILCTYIIVKLAASTTFPLVKKSNIIIDQRKKSRRNTQNKDMNKNVFTMSSFVKILSKNSLFLAIHTKQVKGLKTTL